ncbi:fibronectin type III domain-containing protein [uncultured Kordia sp.]|uniref:fibronectin type III domain-containing protein n=1 Tax=uncultured Kordia sp. TaxID=507699 RepID=UPI00261F270D|nr:fibronectin type III domain-containing protein [uncultured Kordia sp.]
MRKITLLFLILVTNLAFSQVSIGTGSDGGSTNSPPINPYYGFSYGQSIYLASEINANGSITSIDIQLNAGADISSADETVDVWIGHTTKSIFDSTTDWVDVSTLTQVLTSGTITSASDVLTITFTTPFAYNGTDNLIIAIDANESGFGGSSDYIRSTNGPTSAVTLMYRSDSTNPDPTSPPTGTLRQNRGNITFNGIAQACPSPSALGATNITSTSADLGWTENGTAALWNVELVDITGGGTVTGTATSTGVTNSFNIMGLSPANDYEYYVQSDCVGGGLSSWVGPYAFTTACAVFTPEYNADMSTNVPNCWEEADNGDSSSGPMDLGSGSWTSSNHGGTPSNRFNLYLANRSDWIISPEFDLSMAAPSELKVYVALTEGGTSGSGADLGSDDRVSLLMTTDGGTTWSALDAWVQGNVPTDIGEEITYDLSAQTGTVQFAFLAQEGPVDDAEDIYFHVSKFQVRETPACNEITALSETVTSTTEVTINWTAGASETEWTYEYGVSPYTQGGGGMSGTGTVMTTPTLDLTGLTEGETYDIYVQANCGGDDSLYVSLTWTQPSLGETCALPIALTVEADCSTATPTTLDYSASFNLGTTDLSCDAFGVNAGSWYEFVAPATGSVFVNLVGETAEYAVYNGCGMEVVCNSTATNQGEVTGLTAGTTYQLAVWKDSATSGTTDICLEAITCPNPSTLTATTITTTTAILGWTETGSATAWNVEIVDVTAGGMVTGMATNTGVMNPFNATGLNASSEYQFYVQADCGGGDTSDWIGPFTFTTACDVFTPDYDADMSVNVPTCWEEADNGDSSTGPMDLGSASWFASNHNGTASNVFNLFLGGRSDWIISPEFDLSMAAPSELKVYVALTENTTNGSGADLGSDDRVSLLMTTDGGATWSGLQAWVQGNVPTDIGEEITYDLSAQTGTVQFAFLAQEGPVDDTEDIYFHVSKFQVREIPSCIEPSALTATNIMETSADLSWTENGTATAWNVELVNLSAGGTVTGTATSTGVANPFNLTGLISATNYEYYVQSDCAGGESVWVGPFAFSTPCPGSFSTFPIDTDFSVNPPLCWTEAEDGEVAAGPTGTTSDWKANRAYTDEDTNVINSNVINLYQNVDREWLISPVYDIPMGTSYSLDLEVAVTNYRFSGTSTATDTDTMGSDDEVQLLQTIDGGTTWTVITTWNATNQPSVTGSRFVHTLTGVSGNVQFAIWASDGTTDDLEDYDFHIGKFSVLETASLSVNEVRIEGFKYYPNPVTNTLTLKAQKNIQNVAFYNMLGQEVLRVSPNAVSKEINTASLRAGTYFVKVTINNATDTIKIIKK